MEFGWLIPVIIAVMIYAALFYWIKTRNILPNVFDFMGPCLMIKTNHTGIFDKLSRPKKLLIAYANVGIILTVICAVLITITFLITAYLTMLVQPEPTAPQNLLLIPGINEYVPSTFAVWFAIVFAMVIHECGHGILSRVENIKVKSTGILALVIPIGAFVEPDDEDVEKSPLKTKLRMFAAGITTNLFAGIVGVVILILLTGLIIPGASPYVYGIYDGYAAQEAGIQPGTVVYSMDNTTVFNLTEISTKFFVTSNNQTNIINGTTSFILDSTSISNVTNIISYLSLKNNSKLNIVPEYLMFTLFGDEETSNETSTYAHISIKINNRTEIISGTFRFKNTTLNNTENIESYISLITGNQTEITHDTPIFEYDNTTEISECNSNLENITSLSNILRFKLNNSKLNNKSISVAFLSSNQSDIIRGGVFNVSNLSDISKFLSNTKPNQTIKIDGEYKGIYKSYNVTLSEIPQNLTGTILQTGGNSGFIGISFSMPSQTINSLNAMIHPTSIGGAVSSFLTFIILPFSSITGFDLFSFLVVDYPDPAILSAPFEGFWDLIHLLYWCSWLNILLGIFNALPIGFFDGGQMLRETLRAWFKKRGKDEKTALQICSVVTYVLVLALIIPIVMPYFF